MKRIHLLDNQLANQIAAGEVVERPASVVKELVENSIDAGASRIEIDIERGGARLIRILDDGSGIHQDDLALALSRHATSKIQNFEQLCAVKSMGFRGEALASIASVSRLTLRSRLKDSEQGWQAMAEGREMKVQVTPAAAMPGTCVEVADLFFNTPARRKFLRTEKTEFTHIEDVVKRQALANPSVAFVLKHNGKVSKRYPAASANNMVEKIAVACGRPFAKQSLQFSGELDSLQIHGWLGLPGYHRSESDNQFIFVNGRPVKDRLLSHAIRQSYSGLIPQGRFASYVIYIQCPAQDVDVNVHPTKHEVRFRTPRQVHDFLVKLVGDCLYQVNESLSESSCSSVIEFSQGSSQNTFSAHDNPSGSLPYSSGERGSSGSHYYSKGKIAEQAYIYQALSQDSETLASENSCDLTSTPFVPSYSETTGNRSVTLSNEQLWQGRFLIFPQEEQLHLIDVWAWLKHYLTHHWSESDVRAKPLLVPQMLSIKNPVLMEDATQFECFESVGIYLTPSGPNQLMLRKLPELPAKIPSQLWLSCLEQLFALKSLADEKQALVEQLLDTMAQLTDSDSWQHLQHDNWLAEWGLLQIVSDNQWRLFSLSLTSHQIIKMMGKA